MAILKCKMCGGDLEVNGDASVLECEYCGTQQTVPNVDNEKKTNLFNRANRLRFACEFSKAAGIYENIVAEFPEEAEAYWGLCLCKYGIEYVDDPRTAKKIPTCHRTSFESIFEDENFELAQEYADSVAQKIYREEAKEIDRIQKSILQIVEKEEPFDIFICYKETGEDGQRTKDSVMAQDMYDALTKKGYKVFFARITLEDKLGQEYEPYIFAALTSAKIMLSVGTKYEHFNAVWVKNEWSRFLDLMKNDNGKVLIPCYCDIDAYDMPTEFKNLQGQDMGKIGFIQDLVRGIGKILRPVEVTPVVVQTTHTVENALTKRGMLYLEDGEFKLAHDYFERALDGNPEDSKAYIGKVLVALRKKSIEELDGLEVKWDTFKDFERAIRFGTEEEKTQLDHIKEKATHKIAIKQLMIGLNKWSLLKESKEMYDQFEEYYAIKTIESFEKAVNLYQEGCQKILSAKYFNQYKLKKYLIRLKLLKYLEMYSGDTSSSFVIGQQREFHDCQNEIGGHLRELLADGYLEEEILDGTSHYCINGKLEHIQYGRKRRLYDAISTQMKCAKTEQDYIKVSNEYKELIPFEDSEQLSKECLEFAETVKHDKLYQSAKQKQQSENTDSLGQAIREFENIIDWKDAKEQLQICQNKLEELRVKEEEERIKKQEERERTERLARENAKKQKIRTSIILILVGSIVAALVLYNQFVSLPKKYEKANSYLDAQKYEQAVEAFAELEDYKESEELAKEAKYLYVTSNMDSKNETTYEYLKVLQEDSYKDSQDIYNQLYAWNVSMVVNTSKDDVETDMQEIDSDKTVYFRITTTGGYPGEKKEIGISSGASDGFTDVSTIEVEDGKSYDIEFTPGYRCKWIRVTLAYDDVEIERKVTIK